MEARVNDDIAVIVQDKSMIQEEAKPEVPASAAPPEAEQDHITLLRVLRHMLESGVLPEGDLSKKLLSLARHKNPELLAVFEGTLSAGRKSMCVQ
jgi:hypothetical protein